MLYVRLEGEKPPIALQEMSPEMPAGVVLEIALNMWQRDEDESWVFVTDNGEGSVVEDLERPLASYGVGAEDLLLLRRLDGGDG